MEDIGAEDILSRSMNQRSTLLLTSLGVGVYLALVLLSDNWGVGKLDAPPGQSARESGLEDSWPYLIEDTYDRYAYLKRGRWLASGGTPYLQEFSEYPQLTTWMMGLPYLFLEHEVPQGEPYGTVERAREFLVEQGLELKRVDEGLAAMARGPASPEDVLAGQQGPLAAPLGALREALGGDPNVLGPARDHLVAVATALTAWKDEGAALAKGYGDVHHVLMALWFLLLLLLLSKGLALRDARPEWLLLLLAPGYLYFGFNRFDLPITVLVTAAVLLQLRERRLAAHAVLGVAFAVKWYPIVLVPLFLSEGLHAARRRAAARGESWAWIAGLRRHVLVPGLCTLGVILLFLAASYAQGGMEAVTAPFRWHLLSERIRWHPNVREPNHAALASLMTSPESWDWFSFELRESIGRVFLVLSLGLPCLLALLPLGDRRAFLHAVVFATTGMIVCAKFFSPQWVLWVAALGLLAAPGLRGYGPWLVALGVVIYLQLPLSYYHAQVATPDGDFLADPFFRLATAARVALLVGLWLASLIASLICVRRSMARAG